MLQHGCSSVSSLPESARRWQGLAMNRFVGRMDLQGTKGHKDDVKVGSRKRRRIKR